MRDGTPERSLYLIGRTRPRKTHLLLLVIREELQGLQIHPTPKISAVSGHFKWLFGVLGIRTRWKITSYGDCDG